MENQDGSRSQEQQICEICHRLAARNYFVNKDSLRNHAEVHWQQVSGMDRLTNPMDDAFYLKCFPNSMTNTDIHQGQSTSFSGERPGDDHRERIDTIDSDREPIAERCETPTLDERLYGTNPDEPLDLSTGTGQDRAIEASQEKICQKLAEKIYKSLFGKSGQIYCDTCHDSFEVDAASDILKHVTDWHVTVEPRLYENIGEIEYTKLQCEEKSGILFRAFQYSPNPQYWIEAEKQLNACFLDEISPVEENTDTSELIDDRLQTDIDSEEIDRMMEFEVAANIDDRKSTTPKHIEIANIFNTAISLIDPGISVKDEPIDELILENIPPKSLMVERLEQQAAIEVSIPEKTTKKKADHQKSIQKSKPGEKIDSPLTSSSKSDSNKAEKSKEKIATKPKKPADLVALDATSQTNVVPSGKNTSAKRRSTDEIDSLFRTPVVPKRKKATVVEKAKPIPNVNAEKSIPASSKQRAREPEAPQATETSNRGNLNSAKGCPKEVCVPAERYLRKIDGQFLCLECGLDFGDQYGFNNHVRRDHDVILTYTPQSQKILHSADRRTKPIEAQRLPASNNGKRYFEQRYKTGASASGIGPRYRR